MRSVWAFVKPVDYNDRSHELFELAINEDKAAVVRVIVCNLTYTGVLRSGESRPEVLPHLQIISPELFQAAQNIRTLRADRAEQPYQEGRGLQGLQSPCRVQH